VAPTSRHPSASGHCRTALSPSRSAHRYTNSPSTFTRGSGESEVRDWRMTFPLPHSKAGGPPPVVPGHPNVPYCALNRYFPASSRSVNSSQGWAAAAAKRGAPVFDPHPPHYRGVIRRKHKVKVGPLRCLPRAEPKRGQHPPPKHRKGRHCTTVPALSHHRGKPAPFSWSNSKHGWGRAATRPVSVFLVTIGAAVRVFAAATECLRHGNGQQESCGVVPGCRPLGARAGP